MKTPLVKHIFIYLSVIYFLIGGMGFNVVNYCCQTCEKEGIEEIASSSCYNVHHHFKNKDTHQEHKDLLCDDLNQHIDNCSFLRVNTDTPSFQPAHQFQLEQIYSVTLFNFSLLFSDENNQVSEKNNIPPPDNLLSTSGRSILTFHAVLLI